MTFPALETERLLLTELQDDDEAEIFTLFSNPSVVEYYDLAPFTVHRSPFTEPGQAGNLISLFKFRYAEQAGIRWAIRLKATGSAVY